MLFLAAIYLTLARSLVYGALAVAQKIRARRREFDPAFHPPVSVLIAAYNEEKVIARTVRSVLDNGYDDIEVVVVDDGSKDGTLDGMNRNFGDEPRVRILSQVNGGKSAALNRAIAQARNEILVAVDADTIFRKNAIALLVRHFVDSKVGAVSGNARVGNRGKWITRFQSIEYICGFNLDRRALDYLNAITVVPGAVGAWRRTSSGTSAASATTRWPKSGLDARDPPPRTTRSVMSRTPSHTPKLRRPHSSREQRFRWSFGTFQAAWKHRYVTLDPRYGTLGLVASRVSGSSRFPDRRPVPVCRGGNGRGPVCREIGKSFSCTTSVLRASRRSQRCSPTARKARKPTWDLLYSSSSEFITGELMLYVLVKSLVFAVRGRLVGWGKLEHRRECRKPLGERRRSSAARHRPLKRVRELNPGSSGTYIGAIDPFSGHPMTKTEHFSVKIVEQAR